MSSLRMTRTDDARWTTTTTSRPSSPVHMASPTSSTMSLSPDVSPSSHHHPQQYSVRGEPSLEAASSRHRNALSYSGPSVADPSLPASLAAAASSSSTSARGSWDEGETNAGSSSGAGTRTTSRMPEKSMILRRREANRLAAQRFRNRKKGYQDSLEERVRALEQERDGLLERVEAVDRTFKRDSDAVWATPSTKHRRSGTGSATFLARKSGSGPLPPTATDESLRLSGVEAANRRLQDESKWLQEENQALKETIAKWVEWEQSLRRGGRYDPPYDDARHPPHPPHPQSSHGAIPSAYSGRASHSVPPYSHVSPNPQQSPVHSPPLSYSLHYGSAPVPPRPPVDRQESAGSVGGYTPRGSGIQLPPLRLPSLSPSGPAYTSGGPPPGREHEHLPSVTPMRSHPPWPTSPRLQPQHRDVRR